MSVPEWYDAFTDGIAAADARFLACESCGHGTLPPRQVCPECGSTRMSETPMSGRGEILTFTEISVTIPKFQGETPYTVALAEVDGGCVVTGQIRDSTADDIAIGDEVVLDTEPRDDGMPIITLHPLE